jgi:hypothetical protein
MMSVIVWNTVDTPIISLSQRLTLRRTFNKLVKDLSTIVVKIYFVKYVSTFPNCKSIYVVPSFGWQLTQAENQTCEKEPELSSIIRTMLLLHLHRLFYTALLELIKRPTFDLQRLKRARKLVYRIMQNCQKVEYQDIGEKLLRMRPFRLAETSQACIVAVIGLRRKRQS